MRLIDADNLELHKYNSYSEAIKNAPTINPEDLRAKGRWIDGTCSVCKFDAPYIENSTVQILTDFCPNCGAKMEE